LSNLLTQSSEVTSCVNFTEASPGYFSIGLDRFNTTVEMTATHKTSVLRYDFHDSEDATVLINVGDDLMASFMGGSITLGQDSRENIRVMGNGMYRPSFAPYSTFRVYFCSDFNLAASNASLFDTKVHDTTQTTLTGSYGGEQQQRTPGTTKNCFLTG
jgi:putative alpha-1,2-mannosidase